MGDELQFGRYECENIAFFDGRYLKNIYRTWRKGTIFIKERINTRPSLGGRSFITLLHSLAPTEVSICFLQKLLPSSKFRIDLLSPLCEKDDFRSL